MSAARALRLAAKPGGGVRVLERPEDVSPDQLVRLRAHKVELAELAHAFADRGPVLVELRPATPPPSPEPGPDQWRAIQAQQRRAFERSRGGNPWRWRNLNAVLLP